MVDPEALKALSEDREDSGSPPYSGNNHNYGMEKVFFAIVALLMLVSTCRGV